MIISVWILSMQVVVFVDLGANKNVPLVGSIAAKEQRIGISNASATQQPFIRLFQAAKCCLAPFRDNPAIARCTTRQKDDKQRRSCLLFPSTYITTKVMET
jgi:hypothetical protein